MPDSERSGERWARASNDVAFAIPSAALLRATVAGMKCRECLHESRPTEATLQLSMMHDALAALVDVELDARTEAELAKLIDLERELVTALRRAG